MKKIDCLGDFCPIPLLKAKREVEHAAPGETVMVVTDHSCVVESIEEYFELRKYRLEVDEVINGVWEIRITGR